MSRLPEQRLWDRLRKAAANRLYTERIENLVSVGRPDVDTLVNGSFVPMELKYVPRWPARQKARVLGDKGLSMAQCNWHLNWRRWGGRSLIVVGVQDEVFTFGGSMADYVNDYNTAQFRAAALAVGVEPLIETILELSQEDRS